MSKRGPERSASRHQEKSESKLENENKKEDGTTYSKRQRTSGTFTQDDSTEEKKHDARPSKKEDGQRQICQHIKAISTLRERSQLGRELHDLRRCLQQYPHELMVIDRAGFSFLDIALTLPLTRNKDKKLAVIICEELFSCFIEQMQAALSEEDFNRILANRNNRKFGLLQRAITSGSAAAVEKTIALLSLAGREHILTEELSVPTFDNFLPWQQAYMMGNRRITDMIKSLLFKDKWRKFIPRNISLQTFSGFRILATVLKEGTDEDVDEIIKLLSQKEYCEALEANLNNLTFDRFMILQISIRSGSLRKVESVIKLLLRPGHEKVLRANLENVTADFFTTISCAFASNFIDGPAIAERIIQLYTQSKNEDVLLKNLEKTAKDKSNFLQLAVITRRIEMVQVAMHLLLKTQNSTLIKDSLRNRTRFGFRVLQDAYRTKNQRIIEKIGGVLLLPDYEDILILNLENKTEEGYSCLDDVIKSEVPDIVDNYVSLSEKYLPLKTWQGILLSKVGREKRNYLQMAVNSGKVEIVDTFVNAIHRAFGNDAEAILQEMAANMELFSPSITARTRERIAHYLPAHSQQSGGGQDDSATSPLPRFIQRTSVVNSEKELKACLRVIEQEIVRRPEGLMTLSTRINYSHINAILFHVEKHQQDKQFANKIALALFNLMWTQMNARYPERIGEILGATLEDGRTLLLHAVETPFEEITNTLFKAYLAEGNEALLEKQLSAESVMKVRILQAAILSRSEFNVNMVLNLLTQKKFEKYLLLNLRNRTVDGYMPVHEAVRKKSPAILKKLVAVLRTPQHQALLVENLRNRTKREFTLLNDALCSECDESAILIINLSEEYLDPEVWQRRLKELNPFSYNCLHQAANHCHFSTLTVLVDSIVRTFGDQAKTVLNELMKDKSKFRNKSVYGQLLVYIDDALSLNVSTQRMKDAVEDQDYLNLRVTLNKTKGTRYIYTLEEHRDKEVSSIPMESLEESKDEYQDPLDDKTQSPQIVKERLEKKDKNDIEDNDFQEILDAQQETVTVFHDEMEEIELSEEDHLHKTHVLDENVEMEVILSLEKVHSRRRTDETQVLDLNEVMEETLSSEEHHSRRHENEAKALDLNEKISFEEHHLPRQAQKTKALDLKEQMEEIPSQDEHHLRAQTHETETLDRGQRNEPNQASLNRNPLPKTVPPCGGIDAKYLGGALPQLPVPDNSGNNNLENPAVAISYVQNYSLTKFKVLPKIKKDLSLQLSLDLPECQLDYYAASVFDPLKQFTFVLAGRKEEALLPRPGGDGRCVLVLTENEFGSLKKQLPHGYDALVIKSLQSDSHGKYKNLGLPLGRRLGIFLFAYHFDLSAFLMIDDNIKRIKANCRNGGWENFYRLLKNQLDSLYCVSVRTDSDKVSRPGELGSKMFMINMGALKKEIPTLKDVFTLFPIALNEHYWGEDFIFQTGFYVIANFKSQGYEIVPKELMVLDRSKSHRNAFASTGAKACYFDEMDIEALHTLDMERRHWVETIRMLVNNIISQNIHRYKKNKKAIEKANLQEKHAIANQIQRLDEHPQAKEPEDEAENEEFIKRYQSFIKGVRFKRGVFRHYQLKAMGAISRTTTFKNRLLLATAAGKTYIQCELMRMAYHTANPGEHIIVVTPHIDLVKQFYDDFIEFNKKNSSTNNDLLIPPEAIIKVCSHKQSCHVKALLMNEQIMEQTCILIFCSDSLEKFVEEMDYQLPHVPLLLLDEYHYYPSTVKDLVENLEPRPLMVGLTATPPEEDPLVTAFSYTRTQGVKEGYLAPVIADSLGVSYSLQNVEALIYALPTLLKTQYHPGFGDKAKLKDSKGIVYLPSIEHCERALAILKSAGVSCFSIHSQNAKHKVELQEFLNTNQPGVLLAVRMLKIGFNAKALGWAIIGQNADPKEHSSCSNIEQMIGRVMRLLDDKIGYIMCFNNVLNEVVKPLLAQQPLTESVNPDYLAQSHAYFAKGKNAWRVCDVADTTTYDFLKSEQSKFKMKFLINSQQIARFQIEEIEDTSDGSDDETAKDTADFITMLHCGMRSVPLFNAYTTSKKKKGSIWEALAPFGSLIPYLMDEPTSKQEQKKKANH